MRTWGRVTNVLTGAQTWQVVQTDANGRDDLVHFTTLIQVLRLNLGESPFYGDWGIPAVASVLQQVPPDYYVARTQQRFSQYFAALTVYRTGGTPASPTPHYTIFALTKTGFALNASIPIPT